MNVTERRAVQGTLGEGYGIHVLTPRRWALTELQLLLEAVQDLAMVMGGASRFQMEIRGCRVSRLPYRSSAAAMALPLVGVVYFSGASWGHAPEFKWQTVHELAHVWDIRKRFQLSRGLKQATGSRYGKFKWQLPIPFEYEPGGRWLEGRKPPLNALEDWADSVATFVYADYAESLPPGPYGGPRLISPARWDYVSRQMEVRPPYPPGWISYFDGSDELGPAPI
ncbi:MAG: hypothetical protein GTO63_14095 [Anaerolineae bacterium]|nr:hypothetical protein [Anaerolineae bacterium]NIN95977.1 hypothetical protein [Anaerolineae bacterium]NIQ78940.1 hypothetical protein [Anaerolineae bacterium]